MLHARINQEYIDDDEMAKKITFERTLAWVNKLYRRSKGSSYATRYFIWIGDICI